MTIAGHTLPMQSMENGLAISIDGGKSYSISKVASGKDVFIFHDRCICAGKNLKRWIKLKNPPELEDF
jgi:hypothetical protein